MTLFEALKASWTLFGLKAPIFAWVVAGVLLLWFLCLLGRLWWFISREGQTYRGVKEQLKTIRDEHTVVPRKGLSLSAYDLLNQVFEKRPSLRSAWDRFNAQILIRYDEGEDRFWALESAEKAFSDSIIIGPRLNRSFYTAFPGIVTGLGLLFTFLAILVALFDVKLEEKQVLGLDNLIQGLSGKFVSSIAALFAASLFLLGEKWLFHRFENIRRGLVAAIDDLVPHLSPAQILVDLHRDISEQSMVFRHFNADLSTKLRQGFSESMGPTLERMVTTIEDLSQILRKTEAQTQDSLTGSLQELLQKLERSITASLEGMSSKFTETLSGSARQEFDKVINSLGGTAKLLEGMNAQFQTTQSALNDLVIFAKSWTAEQMALGKSQVEELTAVLRGLMVQINETAGSSVSQMAATLTAVVHDLSTKVTELGHQMTSTMVESAGKATSAASTMIEKADNWSSRSAEQLAQLFERYQSHLDRVENIRDTLDTTLARLMETLGQYTKLTADLRDISTQMNAIAASVAGTTKSMEDTCDAVQGVASLTASQVEWLAEANHRQEETWQRIHDSMGRYQQVFGQVEKNASTLLVQIAQNLNAYTETSKEGFTAIIETADNHFKNAVQRLGSSVRELDEFLQDLTEILEKTRPRSSGIGAIGRESNGNR